jgi:hypothetical protein
MRQEWVGKENGHNKLYIVMPNYNLPLDPVQLQSISHHGAAQPTGVGTMVVDFLLQLAYLFG